MLYGTGTNEPIEARAPKMSLDAEPLAIAHMEMLRVTFEIEREHAANMFPVALQSTVPPMVTWNWSRLMRRMHKRLRMQRVEM